MGSASWTTAGSYQWQALQDTVTVHVFGGGGGGCGGGRASIWSGPGGAGGGYCVAVLTGLTVGSYYDISVGARGTGGGGNTAGGYGGSSYFVSSTLVGATGGQGGQLTSNATTGVGYGTGGTAGGGIGIASYANRNGGNGGGVAASVRGGGGGGSSPGSGGPVNGNAGAAATGTGAGIGGAAPSGGNAGANGGSYVQNGVSTTGTGAGGGGGGYVTSYSGGTGGAGGVFLTWDDVIPSTSVSPSISPSISPSASPSTSASPSASPSVDPGTHLVYAAPGTPITFTDSGGSAVITLAGLAANSSRLSARYDRGAGSLPRRYQWRMVFQINGTPGIGASAKLFIVDSDGTYATGNFGTADAAVTLTDGGTELNIRFVGWDWVTSATGSYDFIASGLCTLYDQYFSIIVKNVNAQAFVNTANVNYVIFTPVPEETQ